MKPSIKNSACCHSSPHDLNLLSVVSIPPERKLFHANVTVYVAILHRTT